MVTFSIGSVLIGLISTLIIAIGTLVFALVVPLDRRNYSDFNARLLYYQIYPLILDDFMAKGDCRNVHMLGNMIVQSSDGPLTVTHIIQGGSDIQGRAKTPQYAAMVEEGRARTSSAEETGQFV